jgi:hypothetical protein
MKIVLILILISSCSFFSHKNRKVASSTNRPTDIRKDPYSSEELECYSKIDRRRSINVFNYDRGTFSIELVYDGELVYRNTDVKLYGSKKVHKYKGRDFELGYTTKEKARFLSTRQAPTKSFLESLPTSLGYTLVPAQADFKAEYNDFNGEYVCRDYH